MSFQALLFDAAGTLITTAEPVGSHYARSAARHGISVEPQAVTHAFRSAWLASPPPLHPEGHPAPDDDRGWWKNLVAAVFAQALEFPLQPHVLDDLFEDLYSHYATPQSWIVFEDVLPALKALARNHRLFVLSNFDRRLRSILAGHGLSAFFEQILISSEVGASKPHARMFQAAIQAAGCDPQDCLHIGDDEKCDLNGAQASGLSAFLVKRPEHGLDVLVQKVHAMGNSGLHRPRL